MQVVPVTPETAECYPRTVSSAKAAPSAPDMTEASMTPPSWRTLPPACRRRLVAVLGAIVERTRKEVLNER
jgi:hypothetical protein